MCEFNGKYAAITGGNSGIGAACTDLFAQRGITGIAILDLDRNDGSFDAHAAKLREKGVRALAIACDVTDSTQVKKAINMVIAEFGKIDIAVHCAGVLDNNASVLNTSDELWNRTVAINQSGVFYCCREVLKQMEKQGENGEGVIVNVSSVAGISGNSGASYSASKHAVVGLSKNISIRYIGTGIRCNTVCPGPTTTPMTVVAAEDQDENGLPLDPSFDRKFAEICHRHVDVSIGFIDPMEQAKAIAFFASDDAKEISGQWLQVDRGFY